MSNTKPFTTIPRCFFTQVTQGRYSLPFFKYHLVSVKDDTQIFSQSRVMHFFKVLLDNHFPQANLIWFNSNKGTFQ